MNRSEPPPAVLGSPASRLRSRLFFMGKDSQGNWVVQDRQHTCGGLFANRKDALKFALFENGNRPQAVVMVTDVLELDMSQAADTAHRQARDPYHARRAA